MANRKSKSVVFTAEEIDYELPVELDVKNLRVVGRGKQIVGQLANRSLRTVGLDPDVAQVFHDSESVNSVLRAIIKSFPATTVRTK